MTLDHYTCLETVRRLDAYLDRELSDAERVEVEKHLETCDGCLKRFQFEAAVLDELRTKLRRVSAPATLADRLRAAMRHSAPEKKDA